MGHTYLRLTVLLCLFVNTAIYCFPEDQIMFYPQYRTSNSYPMVNSQFQPMFRNPPMQQQEILHTRTIQPEPPRITAETPPDGYNFTFADFVEALNEISQDKEDQFRTAEHDSNPTYSSPHPLPYGYPTRSGYGSLLPQPPNLFSPSTDVHPPESKVASLKPDLGDLVKPLSKVAGKGVFTSLLTGITPPGLELSGFKDVFLNGVIKPFLAAKTSLKALIAKLVVPVIALVLINVEVLLVVWWLWEDCSKEEKLAEPPHPSPQPAYNNYSNNSYR